MPGAGRRRYAFVPYFLFKLEVAAHSSSVRHYHLCRPACPVLLHRLILSSIIRHRRCGRGVGNQADLSRLRWNRSFHRVPLHINRRDDVAHPYHTALHRTEQRLPRRHRYQLRNRPSALGNHQRLAPFGDLIDQLQALRLELPGRNRASAFMAILPWSQTMVI